MMAFSAAGSSKCRLHWSRSQGQGLQTDVASYNQLYPRNSLWDVKEENSIELGSYNLGSIDRCYCKSKLCKSMNKLKG